MTHINTGVYRGKSFNALKLRVYKKPKGLFKKLLKSKIKDKLPFGYNIRDVMSYDNDLYFSSYTIDYINIVNEENRWYTSLESLLE